MYGKARQSKKRTKTTKIAYFKFPAAKFHFFVRRCRRRSKSTMTSTDAVELYYEESEGDVSSRMVEYHPWVEAERKTTSKSWDIARIWWNDHGRRRRCGFGGPPLVFHLALQRTRIRHQLWNFQSTVATRTSFSSRYFAKSKRSISPMMIVHQNDPLAVELMKTNHFTEITHDFFSSQFGSVVSRRIFACCASLSSSNVE